MRAGGKDWLKWGWVVGCLLTAVFRLLRAGEVRRKQADLRLLILGLFMTSLADFAMVICGKNIEGLYCFLAVQLLYFLRLGRGHRKAAAWLGACSIAGAVSQEPEAVLGLCYFALFTGNLRAAWKRRREEPLFAWGLLLFWLCDLHVGILNMGRFAELPDLYWQTLHPYSQTALWVFYLPSQVLISLSSCNTIKSELSENIAGACRLP